MNVEQNFGKLVAYVEAYSRLVRKGAQRDKIPTNHRQRLFKLVRQKPMQGVAEAVRILTHEQRVDDYQHAEIHRKFHDRALAIVEEVQSEDLNKRLSNEAYAAFLVAYGATKSQLQREVQEHYTAKKETK